MRKPTEGASERHLAALGTFGRLFGGRRRGCHGAAKRSGSQGSRERAIAERRLPAAPRAMQPMCRLVTWRRPVPLGRSRSASRTKMALGMALPLRRGLFMQLCLALHGLKTP